MFVFGLGILVIESIFANIIIWIHKRKNPKIFEKRQKKKSTKSEKQVDTLSIQSIE